MLGNDTLALLIGALEISLHLIGATDPAAIGLALMGKISGTLSDLLTDSGRLMCHVHLSTCAMFRAPRIAFVQVTGSTAVFTDFLIGRCTILIALGGQSGANCVCLAGFLLGNL